MRAIVTRWFTIQFFRTEVLGGRGLKLKAFAVVGEPPPVPEKTVSDLSKLHDWSLTSPLVVKDLGLWEMRNVGRLILGWMLMTGDTFHSCVTWVPLWRAGAPCASKWWVGYHLRRSFGCCDVMWRGTSLACGMCRVLSSVAVQFYVVCRSDLQCLSSC